MIKELIPFSRSNILGFVLITVLSFKAFPQDCSDFHSRICPIPDFSYYYDQQSMSFLLNEGDTAGLNVIVFEKNDYYVSICSKKNIDNIHLRIIEDNAESKVIYDNLKDDYIDFVTFSNDVTRKLIFEISITSDNKNKQSAWPKCAGILIAKKIRVEAF